jgi:hypothetical protein
MEGAGNRKQILRLLALSIRFYCGVQAEIDPAADRVPGDFIS